MAYPTAFPQASEEFAGEYLIEHVIGVGQESVIYAARRRTDDRPCAIRWFYPSEDAAPEAPHTEVDVDPGTGEVRVVGRFRHPNMLEVLEVGTADGAHYIVMDWPDGESLQARLQRLGPMALADVCRLLVPCMRALDEIHGTGVRHLELHPASLLICDATPMHDVHVRVLDFEIAAPAGEAGGTARASLVAPPGLASPYYRAPEQLGQLEVDHRADVYAFGAILYEALTGRPPFAPNVPVGGRPGTLVSARLLPRSSTAQLLPLGVEPIVARAMARLPADRFQSLAELADAVEDCAASRGASLARTAIGGDLVARKPERRTPFQVELPSRSLASSGKRSAPPRPVERWVYAASIVWLVGCFTVLIVRFVESRRSGAVVSYDAATDPRHTIVELRDPPSAPPAAASALAGETLPYALPQPGLVATAASTPVPELAAPEMRASIAPPPPAPEEPLPIPAAQTAPADPAPESPVAQTAPAERAPERPVATPHRPRATVDAQSVPEPVVPVAPIVAPGDRPSLSRPRVPEMKLL